MMTLLLYVVCGKRICIRRPAKHSAPSSYSYNLNVESESESSDSGCDLRVSKIDNDIVNIWNKNVISFKIMFLIILNKLYTV